MRQKRNVLQWLAESVDMEGEPLPGQSILELYSDNRILIENHCGVGAYSRERICVNLNFGIISISGCNMELRQMSKEQLVISGQIKRIDLNRRNTP